VYDDQISRIFKCASNNIKMLKHNNNLKVMCVLVVVLLVLIVKSRGLGYFQHPFEEIDIRTIYYGTNILIPLEVDF
jgi:hypothetical protein